MASPIFYQILNAIETRQPELLEFANLAPEVSALVLDSLFDPRNQLLEGHGFR